MIEQTILNFRMMLPIVLRCSNLVLSSTPGSRPKLQAHLTLTIASIDPELALVVLYTIRIRPDNSMITELASLPLLADSMTLAQDRHIFRRLVTREGPTEAVCISVIYIRRKAAKYTPKQEEFYGAKTGKSLQKTDEAPPGKHTKKLYNSLDRVDVAILAQLRTNISRLKTYLYKVKVAKTDDCDCGALETIQQFLLLCPRWRQKRQGMRAAHGSRYCNVSYALGGYSNHRQDRRWREGQMEIRLECSRSYN